VRQRAERRLEPDRRDGCASTRRGEFGLGRLDERRHAPPGLELREPALAWTAAA
jgi:hypothetical protein